MQVYGPATACLWDDDWDKLDEAEKGARMPWQGAIVLRYSSHLRAYLVYEKLWQHRLRREQPLLDGARVIRQSGRNTPLFLPGNTVSAASPLEGCSTRLGPYPLE